MKIPNRPKVRSMKNITKELWGLCRQIALQRTENPNRVSCYTCPQSGLTGANKQLGHAYPKGALGASMKYDLRILRFQCYNCNINYGGMQAVFWKNLERDMGKKDADKLYLICAGSKGKPVKARDHFTNLIVEYKELLASHDKV